MKYSIVLLFFFIFSFSYGSDCKAKNDKINKIQKKQFWSNYKISNNKEILKIPFKLKRGKIAFSAKINGVSTIMLIDNGSLWDEIFLFGSPITKSLNLKYGEAEAVVGGSGEGSDKQMKIAEVQKISFPNIEFYKQTAIVAHPKSGFSKMFGADGQISSMFFKNFIVEFNFDKSLIILHKPDAYKPKKNSVQIPISQLERSSFTIPVQVKLPGKNSFVKNFMLDLGYVNPLSLIYEKPEEFELNKKNKVVLGKGIQGKVRGFRGIAEIVKLGDISFKNIEVVFNKKKSSKNPKIGFPILSKFNLTFDYINKHLYLMPRENKN